MQPILLCSILAIAIVIERFWTLSVARISPKYVLAQVWTWLKNNQLDSVKLTELRLSSPLGQILAAGLLSSKYGRAAMIDSIEQAAAQVVHDMERYLNTLGDYSGHYAPSWFIRNCSWHDSRIQRNHAARNWKCKCPGRRNI